MIARTVPDLVQPPKIALASDDPRDYDAAFRLVSRSAFLLARQLGRSTEESMDIVQEAALRGWRYRRASFGLGSSPSCIA